MTTLNNAIDTVIHITDIHFCEIVLNPLHLANKRFIGNANVVLHRRHEFALDRIAPSIDYVTRLGIEDLLLTGDFSSTATENEFAQAVQFVQQLEQSGMRPVVLPGNHDVYTFEANRKKRFERYMGQWLPQEGIPSATTLPGGTPVVFVPTVRPNLLSSRGEITDAQIAKVAELLSETSSPMIVAAHYPILHETPTYSTQPGRRLLNADTLRKALADSGREILYLCGHVHRFSYVRDPEFPNLRYLSSGAFVRRDTASGICGDFSVVEVTKDTFNVTRHTHQQEWHHETADTDS